VRLALFAPGHDQSIWLTGWYPQTLTMLHASVTAAGAALKRYWTAGTASVFEVIGALDPFQRREVGVTCDLSSDPGQHHGHRGRQPRPAPGTARRGRQRNRRLSYDSDFKLSRPATTRSRRREQCRLTG